MARSGRKWILALLMALVFPALAVHVSCVAVIGPGTWGSGVEEKVPIVVPGSSTPRLGEYAREFAVPVREDELPPAVPGVAGKVFWRDELPEIGMSVTASHEGETWVQGQRFYLVQNGQASLLPLPPDMIFEHPVWMVRGEEKFLVVGRWQSWAVSPLEKLKRYLRSYLDPALKPEFSLYTYRVPDGPLEYWGPGHTLLPAPNRKRAVLLRSGALGAGYYSLHVWDFERDSLRTVLSMREADPGSGRSFEYRWSPDSRAVQITGRTGGFERRRIVPHSLNLIYLLADDQVYDASR